MAEKAAATLTETLAFRQIVQDPLVVHKPARCLMSLVFTRGARSYADSRASTKCGAVPVSTFDFDRLLRNRRGNVAMMYALVAPVLVFGGGAAIDYGRAAQIHTKLNAAADAAALAALTPAMLQQSSSVAQAAAVSMFNGLTEGIPGLTAHATQVTVTVTVGSTRSSAMSRSATRLRSTPSSLRCSARARCRFRASRRQARRRRQISTSTSCSTIRRRWRCRRRRPASPRCRT